MRINKSLTCNVYAGLTGHDCASVIHHRHHLHPLHPITLPRPSHYISINVHPPPPPNTHTHRVFTHCLSVILCIDICNKCIIITEALPIIFHYCNQYERLLMSCTSQSPSVDLQLTLTSTFHAQFSHQYQEFCL